MVWNMQVTGLVWRALIVGSLLSMMMMALPRTGLAQEASAESAEIKELRSQLLRLQAEVDLLRRRLDELAARPAAGAPAAPPSAVPSSSVAPAQPTPTTGPNAQHPRSTINYDENGLSFHSSDGNFSLRSAVGLQAQFTGFGGNAHENTTFSIRRIRPQFQGVVFKDFRFDFSFDLTGGSALLQNAYVDYIGLAKDTYVRVGQFKTPFGREAYEYSRLAIPFIERSNLFAMTTARNIGIGFGGVTAKRLKWDLALLNGNGINLTSALNDNDALDFAGRASVKVTNTLSVGGNVQIGKEPLNLRGADTPTTVATDNLFIFGGSLPATVVPTGTLATQGLRTRAGGDFRWDFALANHPTFLHGEYIHEVQERENIPVNNTVVARLPDLVRQGFMIQGGVFVTGKETRGLELLGRFDHVAVDDQRDPVLAAAHPVRPEQIFGNPFNLLGNRMNTVTLGANYYFAKWTRFKINYYIQDLKRATTPGGGVGLSKAGVSGFVQLQIQTVF
jgi:phosphate-selective porin